MSIDGIRLTQTVQKGGCAAKVAASELKKILGQVRFPTPHPALMIDSDSFDDAAIYRVSEDLALVQTLDFFTPILDSPRRFGAVAAANALSDVYAMGGSPKTAMGILAFPLATMPESVIVEVLQGASDKIEEAKACFVGGHSIDDDTLKFGLSVTGFANPKNLWTNAGARPGDHLILTKALGTGTLTAGLKRQELSEEDIHEAVASMATLNNVVDFITPEQHRAIHAATDITGFGLSGHSMQLAKASQVSLRIQASSLPVFQIARSCLEKSYLTKAHRTNAEYTRDFIEAASLEKYLQQLIHDPQTSGGLLLSVDPHHSEDLLKTLLKPFPQSRRIGEVLPSQNLQVFFE